LKSSIFKGFILFILSTFFILFTLELFFRIFYPIRFQSLATHSTEEWEDEADSFNESNFRISGTLGYEFAPNSKFRMGTNSLGMLDKERTNKKAETTRRIICIGDSTTAVSEYTDILEELLNNNTTKRRSEVWNCGVPGYGAVQYCRALKEKWLKYDPDMVIMGFCLNDFDTTPLVVKESNRLVGYFPHKEIMSYASPFLVRHSMLYRFIVTRVFIPQKGQGDRGIVAITRSHLQETKELLSERNIDFLIVILGLVERFEDYSRDRRETYEQIKRIARDLDIESIDIVPLFEDHDPEDLKECGDEIHFNHKGSQIVAKAIYYYLNQHSKIKKRIVLK